MIYSKNSQSESGTPLFEGLLHGILIHRLKESTSNPTILCNSCKNILWNPMMCTNVKCSATFCEPCLKKHLFKSKNCPNCLQNEKFEPNNYLKNQILKNLKFSCYNETCKITLKYEELPYHFCEFDQISCEIKDCTWIGTRKDVRKHREICENEILNCPNTPDCIEKFKRRELKEHLDRCPWQNVECPTGCGERMQRIVIMEHTSSNCPVQIISCSECTYSAKRHLFREHKCIPYLITKLEENERRTREMETKYEESLKEFKEEIFPICKQTELQRKFTICTKCREYGCCVIKVSASGRALCKRCKSKEALYRRIIVGTILVVLILAALFGLSDELMRQQYENTQLQYELNQTREEKKNINDTLNSLQLKYNLEKSTPCPLCPTNFVNYNSDYRLPYPTLNKPKFNSLTGSYEWYDSYKQEFNFHKIRDLHYDYLYKD